MGELEALPLEVPPLPPPPPPGCDSVGRVERVGWGGEGDMDRVKAQESVPVEVPPHKEALALVVPAW